MRFTTLTYLLIGLLSVAADHETVDSPKVVDRELKLRYRRIISGHVAQKNAYPYIVSIQAKLHSGLQALLFGSMEHFCGGTLITPNWILTAAHCLYAYTEDGEAISLLNPKKWHVRMATGRLRPSILDRVKGFFNRAYNTFFGYSKLQAFYHVSKIIKHPDYTEGVLENDIALMKLKEPILLHRIKALDYISLPNNLTFKDWPQVGQICTALGWGCACARCPPEMYMQELKMPIIGTKKCRSLYIAPINLTETKEFCAGFYGNNTGICPGDSGGPLVCDLHGRTMLAGVVSATHAKKPESYPAVFTRVSFFSDWIKSIVRA